MAGYSCVECHDTGIAIGGGQCKRCYMEVVKWEKAKRTFEKPESILKTISELKSELLGHIKYALKYHRNNLEDYSMVMHDQSLKDLSIALYYLSILGEVPSKGIALDDVSVPPTFKEDK